MVNVARPPSCTLATFTFLSSTAIDQLPNRDVYLRSMFNYNLNFVLCLIIRRKRRAFLGKDGSTKSEEFSEKFQKGGGAHFQTKNLCCRFWTFKQGFFRTGSEKKNLQHDLPKMRVGAKAVCKFIRFISVTCPLLIHPIHCKRKETFVCVC